MFAYCRNNPVNYLDPRGTSPLAAAAAGGAVAGALISLTSYLSSEKSNASFGEALLAVSFGAIGGALGGAAGVASGDLRFACIIGAGTVSALYANVSGGSGVIGGLSGLIGAYGGTLLDTSMFLGFDLAAANYLTGTYIGFFAEMFSQVMNDMVSQQNYENSQPNSLSSGAGASGIPNQKPSSQMMLR